MKWVISALILFTSAATAQFNISSPLYVASFLRAQAAAGGCAISPDLYFRWETDGTESVGGVNFTANNSPTDDTGIIDNAQEFVSASSQSYSRADEAAVSLSSDFTIDGWIWLDVLGQNNSICSKDKMWAVVTTANKLYFYCDEIRDLLSDETIAEDTWTYFAVGYRSSDQKIFLRINNNTTKVSTLTSGAPTDGVTAFYWAAYLGSSFFLDGRLDECAVTRRALSDSEMLARYNSGAGCRP